MYTSGQVICYDYEYRRPCEKSMRYNADKYYRIYKKVSSKWYDYIKQSAIHGSILDVVKTDFPRVPRMVLSDIVNSISINMGL